MSIKTKFCAKCGKETDLLLDTICAKCYLDINPIKVPKKLIVVRCKKCNSIYYQRLWLTSDMPLKYHLHGILLNKIVLPESTSLESLDILNVTDSDIEFELTLKILGQRIKQTYAIPLELREKKCPNCFKGKKAHRAILQLRSENPEEFLQKISKILANYNKKVIKAKEFAKGIDLFFPSRAVVLKLVSDIKKKIPVKITETSKAKGWDRTKNKPRYISTILLRER